jgi:predicted transcriptional regulator
MLPGMPLICHTPDGWFVCINGEGTTGKEYFYYVYMSIHVYMPQGTTVRISLGTKAVLDELKIHPKESYDEVIGRLSHLAYDDEPMTDEELQALKEGLEDVKTGRARSLEEIMQDLGDDKVIKISGKNGVHG